MAAIDCVGSQCAEQVEQMKLFMSAREVKNWITDSTDRSPNETLDDMWKRKLRESKSPRGANVHGAGVYDAVSEGKSILPDLTLIPYRKDAFGDAKNVIGDGHHRIAAMADVEAKTGRESFTPVKYFGNSGFEQPVPKIASKPTVEPNPDHLFTSSGLG